MRKNLLWVSGVAIGSLLLFWLPFFGHWQKFWGISFGNLGMSTIVQNFDGLNFLVVVKSWYNPEIIEEINRQFLTGNDPIYFVAHFPLFSVIIKLFAIFFSLPYALIATIILGNILLAVALYQFFRETGSRERLAVIVAIIGLFFPARMLSVRSVGSNEPYFIAFILWSLIASMRGHSWRAAIMGALAVLTRSPGILLFGVYLLSIINGKWSIKRFLPYLLMPLTLIALFGFYGYQLGDYWAYFHSGDNLHLFFPPFAIFSNIQSWITDMWREDIIYLYLFYGVGIWQVKDRLAKYWGLIYGGVLLLVAHRDLARYSLPVAPIALLGYVPWIAKVKPQVWVILAILLIPIYLLGWQFVVANIAPISDWSVFR